MWFLFILIFGALLWLLWTISGNTRDAVDRQIEIQRELKQLNALLSEKFIEQPDRSISPARGASTAASTVITVKPESNVSSANETIHTAQININDADIKTLQTLPGVGKTVAQKIIDARPFTAIKSLSAIPGISDEMLQKLEPLITI